MPTVEEVTAKYIELRDRKAEIEKQQKEAVKPISEAMEQLESWLLNKMNQDAVDSFKTSKGTAYKSVLSSVKINDSEQFKSFVLRPAANQIRTTLQSMGYIINDYTTNIIENILRDKPLWDMVDFRAGKKGIVSFSEEQQAFPPGVTVDYHTAVNIRRSGT